MLTELPILLQRVSTAPSRVCSKEILQNNGCEHRVPRCVIVDEALMLQSYCTGTNRSTAVEAVEMIRRNCTTQPLCYVMLCHKKVTARYALASWPPAPHPRGVLQTATHMFFVELTASNVPGNARTVFKF